MKLTSNEPTTAVLTESFTEKKIAHFDEGHVLHELKHFLPSQQSLKEFIKHKSLHAVQHQQFYDASV